MNLIALRDDHLIGVSWTDDHAVATYDLHAIHTIINSTPVVHVSFNSLDPDDPFPTILPMM